jgi:hypothetical protein
MMDLRPYKKTGATQRFPALGGVDRARRGPQQGRRLPAHAGVSRSRSRFLDAVRIDGRKRARLNNAFRRFGSGWCLHVEARRAPAPGYPDSGWPDALSWLIDEERRAVFEAAGARFESAYF